MAAAERMLIPSEWVDSALTKATQGMEPSPYLDRIISRERARLDQMTISVVTRPPPDRIVRLEPPPGK